MKANKLPQSLESLEKGDSRNLTLFSLLSQALQLWIRPWSVGLWVLLVLTPLVYGGLRINSYVLPTRLDTFSIMMSGIVPLTFPFVVTFAYVVQFSSELTNNYIVYTRSRVSMGRYIASKFIANAIIVFAMFFSTVVIAGAFAFLVEPALRLRQYDSEILSGSAETITMSAALTFSQLLDRGSLVYTLVYASWVGLGAAVVATVALCATLITSRRLIAISLPAIIYYVDNFVLALLGLAQFRTITSIFPFGITQQPLWVPLISMSLWLTAILIMVSYVVLKRFELPPLV